jgi:hypothetical protein
MVYESGEPQWKTTLSLLLSRVYTDESRRLVFQTGLLPSSLRVRGPPSGRRAVRHGAVLQEIFQTIAGPATGNVAEFQGAQKRVPLWKRGIPQYEVNTARRTGVSSELYQAQGYLLASLNTTGTVLGTGCSELGAEGNCVTTSSTISASSQVLHQG